jgi:hypothetical protein
MKKDSFSTRKNELEEKFFSKRDKELLEALREKVASKERKKALAEASGIDDETLLDQLDEIDVRGETLAALSLVPLVAVAWADGTVDARERKAVMAAAEQRGIERGHAGYQLLDGWLEQKPDPKLLAVWKGYVEKLSPSLSEPARNALKQDLLGRARAVAEAAGGLLGLGNKVSKAEQAVLDDLEKAFG